MRLLNRAILRSSLTLIISTLLVSACSSSSDSSRTGMQLPTGGVVTDANADGVTIDSGNPVSENPSGDGTEGSDDSPMADNGLSESLGGTGTGTETETETETETQFVTEIESTTEVTDQTISDPLSPNTTRVTFDITVPAYQSDQLRVELNWGDINLNAGWVGDELWTVSGDFPTDTQALLVVTFYDLNGDIALARSSQEFKTGINGAQALQIPVEQFDASLFDTDEDGVSNLDESIAGTDPSIDEDSLLPIEDRFVLSQHSRMSVSRHFDSHIPEERPFSEMHRSSPLSGVDLIRDVDIDAEGTGTLRYYFGTGSVFIDIWGTRTSSDNSVSWDGLRSARDDWGHSVSVNSTVTYVDENTRTYVEQITGTNVGTYSESFESSLSLTGRVIEGTDYCKPIAGTASLSQTKRGETINKSIAKGVDDQYWRVGGGDGDYFVRDLVMLRSYCGTLCGTYTKSEPEDAFFKCDFADFQQ